METLTLAPPADIALDLELALIIPSLNGASRESRALAQDPTNLELQAALPGDTLHRTFEGYQDFFGKRFGNRFGLFMANDGSTDETATIAREHGVTVFTHEDGLNHGRGTALRNLGFLVVGDMSEVSMYTDDDHSYSPETLLKLYESIHNGADVAVAYRDESAAKQHTGRLRRLAHSALHAVCEPLAPTGVRDPQAGAKAFSRAVARQLWERVTIDGWAADRQVLNLAYRAGLNIDQIGAKIIAQKGSTVNDFRDAGRMIRDSLIIYRANRFSTPIGVKNRSSKEAAVPEAA